MMKMESVNGMSGKYMLRKRPVYIPKDEVSRDYRNHGDLDPSNIIYHYEFKEYGIDENAN